MNRLMKLKFFNLLTIAQDYFGHVIITYISSISHSHIFNCSNILQSVIQTELVLVL
jgi:hypothetical protein